MLLVPVLRRLNCAITGVVPVLRMLNYVISPSVKDVKLWY